MTIDPIFAPGCYFDSHHGHYIVPMIVRFAGDYGFGIDAEVQDALDRYDGHSHEEDFPAEMLIEVSEEAINFLNEKCVLHAHTWQWNDGDFGLYADEDDE